MKFLFSICISLFSVLFLFFAAKVLGHRQIANFTVYDYVNTITIGSIAGEMAAADDFEMAWEHFVPLVAFIIFTLFLDIITNHYVKARRYITGPAITLIENGKFYKKNFKKTKLDLNEFLSACRVKGYFDVSQIKTAILEPNGAISIMTYSDNRPTTPTDLKLEVEKEEFMSAVILDGEIMEYNLKALGFNAEWLKNKLKTQFNTEQKKIFLAICDKNGKMKVFESVK